MRIVYKFVGPHHVDSDLNNAFFVSSAPRIFWTEGRNTAAVDGMAAMGPRVAQSPRHHQVAAVGTKTSPRLGRWPMSRALCKTGGLRWILAILTTEEGRFTVRAQNTTVNVPRHDRARASKATDP